MRKGKDFSSLVALGTKGGLIKLVDLRRNRVVSRISVAETEERKGRDASARESHEYSTVYSLDWNSDGFLAIASTEDLIYIKDFDGEAMTFVEDTSLTVNSPSRCVSWSPLNQKLLATGLFNGNIVIFDMASAEVKHILRASSAEEDFRVMHI